MRASASLGASERVTALQGTCRRGERPPGGHGGGPQGSRRRLGLGRRRKRRVPPRSVVSSCPVGPPDPAPVAALAGAAGPMPPVRSARIAASLGQSSTADQVRSQAYSPLAGRRPLGCASRRAGMATARAGMAPRPPPLSSQRARTLAPSASGPRPGGASSPGPGRKSGLPPPPPAGGPSPLNSHQGLKTGTDPPSPKSATVHATVTRVPLPSNNRTVYA